MQSGDNITSADIVDNGFYPVYGANGFRGYYSSYNKDGKYILIGRQGALAGNVHLVNGKFWATDHAVVTTLNTSKVKVEYLAYSFHAMNLNQYAFDTAAQPGLAVSKIILLYTSLPPLAEQHSIVSYLDTKCTLLDTLLSNKEKEISLLQEMKQRVIADAVTRGVNPNVKFKATNIPWLPEIPEHWELETLRNFLKMESVKNRPEMPLLSVTREQGVIVRDIGSKEENHNFIPTDLSGYKYVAKGDFCINKMKSWQGSYGVSGFEGIVSPAYFVCKLSGVDSDFFSLAIRSKMYVSFFAQYSKGIRVDQWDLSPIGLRMIPFFLPPLSEQRAIVSYITERTSKIDTLIEKLTKEIECVKEYKQRLISDVVTGQVKVC